MLSLILSFLFQTPIIPPPVQIPLPVPECTIEGLKLSTSVLSEKDAKALALKKWGYSYIIRQEFSGTNTSSTIQFGFRTIMGSIIWFSEDTGGSYRRAWNNALLDECNRLIKSIVGGK